MNEIKKLKIKETLKATKNRRSLLQCKTYELKINKSKISKACQAQLDKLFLESKWLYNHILSLEDRKTFDSKITKVNVRNKKLEIEERELTTISSQVKQSLNTRISNSIYALSVLKKNGFKVGKLKFKPSINCIPLKQYGITYRINKHHNKLNIQGIKQSLHVNGLHQIQDVLEFGNANFIRKYGDYYLKITCYERKEYKQLEGSVGIDFGIETSIVLNTGEKFNVCVPVNKKIKKLHKRHCSKVKKSKNRIKAKIKLQKAYDKTNHQKADLKNKIVSKIVNKYKIVCFQDENIQGWQRGWYGVQVNRSALGGIMRDLKTKSHTPVMIARYYASTQECPICKKNTYHSPEKREYECSHCGYTNKCRDTHSAGNMLSKGLSMLELENNKIPMDNREFKPVETNASFAACGDKCLSGKQEAHGFNRG